MSATCVGLSGCERSAPVTRATTFGDSGLSAIESNGISHSPDSIGDYRPSICKHVWGRFGVAQFRRSKTDYADMTACYRLSVTHIAAFQPIDRSFQEPKPQLVKLQTLKAT